jgi:hypothetical protein
MNESFSTGVDPELVRRIVAEVVRRIGRLPQAPGSAAASTAAGVPAAATASVRPTMLTGRVISLAMLERLPAGTGQVAVESGAILTPSARDHARERGLEIVRPAGPPAVGPATGPFLVAHAECEADAVSRAAAIVRAVPGSSHLPASGLADVVAAVAIQASRAAARGMLLTGRPAAAAVLANRSASLRAVTARDPAALAAAAAECNANLLVIDPRMFPAAAAVRLARELASRPAGETPALLTARLSGCGCKGHPS